MRILLSLSALMLVVACSPSASQKGGRGGGSGTGTGAPAAGDVSLEDVVRYELQRISPRVLAPAIDPESPEVVRARAALALARTERTDAAPLLMQASKDESAQVRARAAFGLGQLDLGLVDGVAVHDATRRGVEEHLALWLKREENAEVRGAIVRALGRLATGKGIDTLLDVAGANSADRAAALYALGVAGSRREASLTADKRLHSVIEKGLASSEVGVQRAAAYATFRQKIAPPDAIVSKLRSVKDGATRIHIARAMGETLKTTGPAVALLKDGDWRVRVEAVRIIEASLVRGGPTSS